MANETRSIGTVLVQRTKIAGNVLAYSAWEIDANDHSTISHFDGVRYGKVGTTRLTPALDALPAMTEERSTKVRAYIDADKERAYAAIVEAFPEASAGQRDGMGEIEVWP